MEHNARRGAAGQLEIVASDAALVDEAHSCPGWRLSSRGACRMPKTSSGRGRHPRAQQLHPDARFAGQLSDQQIADIANCAHELGQWRRLMSPRRR